MIVRVQTCMIVKTIIDYHQLFWDPLKFFLCRTFPRAFSLPTQLLSWCFSLEPFAQLSSSCSLFKSDFWLEKCWSSILQLYKNYKMSKHKLVPALALKWYPQGSWDSHRTSKVVWHLCSQSESRCQMHLQPSHFSLGPQQGAFYRKQFVIWARLLI